jgi:hypothetical protein
VRLAADLPRLSPIRPQLISKGLRKLLLVAEPTTRRRFLDECLMPKVFPAVAATTVDEEVLA